MIYTKITLLLILLFSSCCVFNKKTEQVNDRWHENCPYTEDNCGYPYENY